MYSTGGKEAWDETELEQVGRQDLMQQKLLSCDLFKNWNHYKTRSLDKKIMSMHIIFMKKLNLLEYN